VFERVPRTRSLAYWNLLQRAVPARTLPTQQPVHTKREEKRDPMSPYDQPRRNGRLTRAGVRATSCFTVVHQSCRPVIPCCLLIELRCPREQRVRGQSPGERGRSGMPGETETNADCMADGHERLDAPALVLWLAKPGDVVLRESLRQRHSRQGDGRLRPERAGTLTRR